MATPIERIHGSYVHGRRDRVLADLLAGVLPEGVRVLDVGAGDGLLAKLIMERRPDVRITGIDVLVRESTHVPVEYFDGQTIPHPDRSFDAVMFVDVLHHTPDPFALLQEAARVSAKSLIIKDHTLDGILAGQTLRFMDDVGNKRHGVVLPYNYWPKRRWDEAFRTLHLRVVSRRSRLGLYPVPVDWVFGRGLHFIAHLEREGSR